MRARDLAMSAVCLIAALASPAQAQDVCRSIIDYASRDETDDRRAQSTAFAIYSEHCEGSSYKSGSNTQVGIEAVVKAVPLKFNLGTGSNEEKMNNFCKTYASSGDAASASSIKSSIVVRESLDAFNNCIYLSNKGVYFSPKISKTSVTVDVSRGSEAVMILGVLTDKKRLSCTVPGINGSENTQTADENTRKSLDGGSFPISCSRTAVSQDDGTQSYPSADLSIVTSRGSLSLPIRADAELPTKWASELSDRISKIDVFNNSMSEFRSKLSLSVVTAGSQPSSWAMTPWNPVYPTASCPAGQFVTGINVVLGGSCRGQCDPDGRPVAGYTIVCSSAALIK